MACIESPMYLRHRHRRGIYPMAEESSIPRIVKSLVKLAIALFILYWVGSWLLRLLGFGAVQQRDPATLRTEGRGLVTISLQGEAEQTAENGMNVFARDALATGSAAQASLQFFDGTWVRMDERTELLMVDSLMAEEDSRVRLALKSGRAWVRTPRAAAWSGSIVRAMEAPTMRFLLPMDTEAIVTPASVQVYSADGAGVEVVPKDGDSFFIGEGQKWSAPADGEMGSDPLAARSALSAADWENQFLLQSRTRAIGASPGNENAEPLTVTAPAEGFVLRTPTLEVQGRVNADVKSVLVNGHTAVIDASKGSFAQQVAPPEGAKQMEIDVKALDEDGNAIATVARTVQVSIVPAQAPSAPTIVEPAGTGQTYATSAEEIVIRGTVPAGTAGVMVNEYKLQLFTPEKGTWSYLASQKLGNMKQGNNVYDVYALDASGAKSPASRITIVVGSGQSGIVSSTGTAASAAPPPKNNAPLTPGSLTVTGPTPGLTHTATGTGFLLEGRTSAQTHTMWVNDYQLQLYLAKKTTWNYIAAVEFKNLKPGKNTYTVVARNEKGEVLDRLEYVVTYEQ